MNETKDDLLSEITDSEEQGLRFPIAKRKIYTEQGDPEIDSLYRKWKDGELNIQPDFQRGFVWDIGRASRLIESILLDIPLPVVYLSEEKSTIEYVIDGQQRLTTFFSFIDGKLPDPELPHGKDFKLTKLTVYEELNGKFFKDLDREFQKKIRYYKIRTITFKKDSETDLKFEVFERLNTGSVSLNDQELRNCIYRGKFNDLLWELSEDPTFKKLLGIKKPEKRMRDVELVLRFSAFFHSTYMNYKPPMKKFLNQEMEQFREISPVKEQVLKSAFKSSVSIIYSLLGENAFKRFYIGDEKNPNGTWEKKQFNASLYDILMDSFARVDKNNAHAHLDSIREAYINLVSTDNAFIEAIVASTSSVQAVRSRFRKWDNVLNSVISFTHKEPRCFSFRIKEELFNKNSACAICGQNILNIDDAAVDHVKQYWQGGKTIPENARLTHKYCNSARDRKEGQNPQPPLPPRGTGGTGKRRVLAKGCTVDGRHFESGFEAIYYLQSEGKIREHDLPRSNYNAHKWLEENYYKFGFSYKRDNKAT
ncbi:MAG: hypothetical protein FMNOHCHN_01690 [Ignavibacteriaceae bacterium]|nr:hypothetical protein [Ignavibacteriaceae bacterium]